MTYKFYFTPNAQEGDLEPEPIVQLCIEHVLDPENAPSQNDIDQDDLELMNGSLDPNTENETQDEKKSSSRNDANENGTTAIVSEREGKFYIRQDPLVMDGKLNYLLSGWVL